ncbi:EamA family transporter [Horticoccus sp. 23ND18S-11]|uniref:EamA family transporter n=1 Tax=Horticoccus sp. 23ND18S-11 TaxID=3391832 RepID=UPI0039C9040B
MHWIVASLVSAFFLGCYDLFTKHAVRDNAVLPVLFFANVCSATIWLALMSFAAAAPGVLPASLVVEPMTLHQHGQLILKSAIVATSWVCSYFAVKQLPVSIASPIKATGPIWTLFGALLVLGERPSWLEMLGILITLGSFFGLSVAGRAEGIHFHRNKWIGWLLAGTLFGTVSGLYDKYLLGHAQFTASTVQAWFSIYLALLFLPLAIGWKLRWWPRQEFHWRWSVPMVSVALLVCDFIYFTALRDPESLVSVVASLRRGSILVAFAGGMLLFGELNGRKKLPAILGVLAGIILTVVG